MTNIKLNTAAGEFVHEAKIPEFNKAPDVIFWGQRVFRFIENKDGVLVYNEAFSFAVA